MKNNFIPLSRPCLGGNEWLYVKECLDTGWVSSAGPFIDRFEKAVAFNVGAEDAVAVSSGTAALHTALLVMGVKAGDEVIAPALTFVSPINAICYVNASPVFMDVSPDSWNLDVNKLASFLAENCEVRGEECFNKKSQKRIRAIVAVHLLGNCCDMDPILDMAKRYHLKVIEDAAEAMGVLYKGKSVGTLGDIGCFSFNGNKVITCGGGGMIVAKNKKDLDYARYLTTQAKDDPLEYIHNEIGYNYRLTSLQAAVGLAQLEQLDQFVAKKRQIASFYQEAFKDLEELTLMSAPSYCESTWWLYTVLLGAKRSLQERKDLLRTLKENGIDARPFWHPIYTLAPYKNFESYKMEKTMSLYERGVCLPSSVDVTPDELQKVVAVFKKSLASL
ncbi:MAG: LegC family aminotransferase [Deltaproteobacteria bacterium]|nr:LegC family aminotransferase [Deltaproteobacteria bacterium]